MPKRGKSKKNKNVNNNNDVKSAMKDLRKMQNMLVSGARGVGMSLGGPAGGAAGAIAGRALGSLAGSKLSKLARWVGHGDYIAMDEVAKNSLIHGRADTNNSFGPMATHSYHFTKREYIGSIRRRFSSASGVRFEVSSFPIQPGNSKVFPVTSILAPAFTKYRCHGLVFELVTAVSSYSSVSQTGTVAVTCDYNPSNPPFSSKVQMENTSGCIAFAPYKSCCYGIECDPNRLPYKEYFIRTGNTDAVPNVNEDMGNFQVALCDLPTTYAQGDIVCELWVTGEWTFFEDRMPTAYSGFVSYNGAFPSSSSPFGNETRSIAKYGAFSNVSIGRDISSTGGVDPNSIYPLSDAIYLDGVPMGTILIIVLQFQNDADLTSMTTSIVTPTAAVNGCVPAPILPDNGSLVASRVTNDTYTTNVEKYTFEIAVQVVQESGTGFAYCPYVEYNATISGSASTAWTSVMMYCLGQGSSFTSL